MTNDSLNPIPPNYRRKMCEHCAFRSASREMTEADYQEFLVWECMHRTFFCHETMFQRNEAESKWSGDFDPDRKRDGSPATIEDHQLCAGFMKFYGSDYNIDTDEIPTENHALAHMMRKP